MSSNEIRTSEIGTTAFLGVFEQKLEKMKSRLKTELGKKRNEREASQTFKNKERLASYKESFQR